MTAFAQSGPSRLTSNFVFNNGIYSSFDELIKNNPKFPDCKFDMSRPNIGYPKNFYYYDEKNVRQHYNDYLFAVVDHGILFLWFNYFFFRQYYLGRIGIFYETTWHSYSQNKYDSDMDIQCILDFNSGKISFLNQKSILESINGVIDISEDSTKKIKKLNTLELIPVIMKFNDNHAIYID
jgi:hypothetical protein